MIKINSDKINAFLSNAAYNENVSSLIYEYLLNIGTLDMDVAKNTIAYSYLLSLGIIEE